MRLTLYLTCSTTLLLLPSVFVNSERHFYIDVFVKVIMDIRKFYSAATVVFAHPGDEYGDYGDLSITHLVHTCSRMLGRHYVVTLDDLPISSRFGSSNYVGSLYEKVVEELTHSLNFSLDIVSELDEHGMWNPKNHSWSGVMNEIVSGRADFAIADMSMTSFRVRYVDFTLPLIISKNSLFIREPGVCGVKWLGYFQTFGLRIWVAIVMLIAVTPLLLSFMKTCLESRNTMDLLSDNFLCIWGIFCQQALIAFPRYSSLRLAYFTIFLTAVLITAHYSAALVCFLTSCIRVLPFRTIDEFVADGTYQLIIQRGGADYDIIAYQSMYDASKKTFSTKLMRLMKKESELPENIVDGFVQICKEKKVAYMILNILKKSVEMKIPCKLSSVSTERIDNLGMVLSKGNPYTAVINYHIQKFLDNGIMMRLRNTRFLTHSTESKAFIPVYMVNVIPILAILCGGIILSVAVLIMEKIYYRYKKKKLQSRIFYRSKKQLFLKGQ
ncbi:glutamate receptor 1-like [Formica exsecta]|uniref:glutamate receptor 1-like n=1 Tax=Formica exsecta TaxID=72781 RepID=UPI0011419305|nr:glutamate receptor 1-like [Formica exsecta]